MKAIANNCNSVRPKSGDDNIRGIGSGQTVMVIRVYLGLINSVISESASDR